MFCSSVLPSSPPQLVFFTQTSFLKAFCFSPQLFSSCKHHLSLHLCPLTVLPGSSHPSFSCFYLPVSALLTFFSKRFTVTWKHNTAVLFSHQQVSSIQRRRIVYVRTYKRSMLTSFALTVSLHPLTPIDLLRRIFSIYQSIFSPTLTYGHELGEWQKEWDCRYKGLELVSWWGGWDRKCEKLQLEGAWGSTTALSCQKELTKIFQMPPGLVPLLDMSNWEETLQ